MGNGHIPDAMLPSGFKMPLIGLGTAALPASPPEVVYRAVLDAVEAGYRHFDSAALYGSEEPIGKAIKEALQQGLVDSRHRFFVTSKLWCSDAYPEGVLPALQNTLRKLQLEYLDLYLIHLPLRLRGASFEYNNEGREVLPLDISGTWAAMEECQRLGLAKSIGVSNFACKKLGDLLLTAKIPPAVNQVEMHPLWQQVKLRELCASKGIHVTAWSPLGAYGNTMWGTHAVLENPVLKEIAQARGKTVAQVCLRWVVQQDASLVVKSFRKERMKENLDIFDWQLTREELDVIQSLPQTRFGACPQFISSTGPFKSLEELWDGRSETSLPCIKAEVSVKN